MSYEEWLERARFFLKEAVRYYDEKVYWATCFNAHQSAEFYLKGFLLKIANLYPFTHDLAILMNELSKNGLTVPEDVQESAEYLTPHYTGSRYPGTRSIVYDEKKAHRCLEHAKRIAEFIEGLL